MYKKITLICLPLLVLDRIIKTIGMTLPDNRGMVWQQQISWGISGLVNSGMAWGVQAKLPFDYLTGMIMLTVLVALWGVLYVVLTHKVSPAVFVLGIGLLSNLIDWFIWGGTSDPLFVVVVPYALHINLADFYIWVSMLLIGRGMAKNVADIYKELHGDVLPVHFGAKS